MGSMTKVMQKIEEDSSKPEPTATGTATQPENSASATPSAFVPEHSPGQAQGTAAGAPTGPTIDRPEAGPPRPETAAWDVKRVDPAIIAFHDRYSAISEQYRSVQARLLTMNTARVPQVIAVTSAIPEEGKSVSAVNLSLVMAEGGEHRILLADGDFRRTCIARMLGIPDKPGLAEVLSGEVSLNEALQSTPLPNLKVLPAGKVRDSAYAELLGGPATATVLSDLRSAFDYTFLDTPPITTVSDVCLLAPRCDGAMIVIQMRRTPEPTVQQAVRALQANNVKVIGCILSRFQERGAGYYERYYSYYYYR